MNSFEMPAYFSDEVKTLKVNLPVGGDGYQILIDNYYQGVITRRKGEWVGHFNETSELTLGDIQVIGQIIENKFGDLA